MLKSPYVTDISKIFDLTLDTSLWAVSCLKERMLYRPPNKYEFVEYLDTSLKAHFRL